VEGTPTPTDHGSGTGSPISPLKVFVSQNLLGTSPPIFPLFNPPSPCDHNHRAHTRLHAHADLAVRGHRGDAGRLGGHAGNPGHPDGVFHVDMVVRQLRTPPPRGDEEGGEEGAMSRRGARTKAVEVSNKE